MSVQLSNGTKAILSQWARLNGVSVAALVNWILMEACSHFLDGQKAAGLPQLTHNPELAARKKTKQIAAWNRRAGLRIC